MRKIVVISKLSIGCNAYALFGKAVPENRLEPSIISVHIILILKLIITYLLCYTFSSHTYYVYHILTGNCLKRSQHQQNYEQSRLW